MHTIKLLLTYYLNISVQAANLSDCRIESNRIETFFARIGMLYEQAHCEKSRLIAACLMQYISPPMSGCFLNSQIVLHMTT